MVAALSMAAQAAAVILLQIVSEGEILWLATYLAALANRFMALFVFVVFPSSFSSSLLTQLFFLAFGVMSAADVARLWLLRLAGDESLRRRPLLVVLVFARVCIASRKWRTRW